MSEYCRLTKPSDSDIVPGRKYGVYECPGINGEKSHTWVSLNATDKPRKCRYHHIEARCISIRELVYGDYPDEKRLYGHYTCLKCSDKEWGSAWSWKGYSQDCKNPDCKTAIFTLHMNFLKGGSGNASSGHCKELCGKCKALGDCRSKTDQ